MIESRWERIIPPLQEFQSHLASHIPPLRIQHLNDRRWSGDLSYRYDEQLKTGLYDKFGVYLIFNACDSLEYVGLAMNSFHDRIWGHDDHVDRLLTDVIAIPHEYYFLGPALEFFLICRLNPPKNKIYNTGYTIPAAQIPSPGGSE
jgi:hypothetical protein